MAARAGDNAGRLSAALALAASLLSCYGTLAAVTVLSALGVSLALDESVWAGAILFFAAAATALLARGRRRHGSAGPLALALAGTALLAYTLLVSYDRMAEAAAFALIAAAVYWDYRRRG